MNALRRRRGRQHFGLHRATVVDATDPQQHGRVQVTVPAVSSAPTWAPTLRDVGGLPGVGDEVLVGFESGDAARPYVLGVVATTPPQVELADDNGNLVRLTTAGVEISSSGTVRINASQIKLSAGMGQADAGMWKFSGVVQSDTLITNSVVASSYTPGAGNIQ